MKMKINYYKDPDIMSIEVLSKWEFFDVTIDGDGDIDLKLDHGYYIFNTTIAELKQIITAWETRKNAKEA